MLELRSTDAPRAGASLAVFDDVAGDSPHAGVWRNEVEVKDDATGDVVGKKEFFLCESWAVMRRLLAARPDMDRSMGWTWLPMAGRWLGISPVRGLLPPVTAATSLDLGRAYLARLLARGDDAAN